MISHGGDVTVNGVRAGERRGGQTEETGGGGGEQGRRRCQVDRQLVDFQKGASLRQPQREFLRGPLAVRRRLPTMWQAPRRTGVSRQGERGGAFDGERVLNGGGEGFQQWRHDPAAARTLWRVR